MRNFNLWKPRGLEKLAIVRAEGSLRQDPQMWKKWRIMQKVDFPFSILLLLEGRN